MADGWGGQEGVDALLLSPGLLMCILARAFWCEADDDVDATSAYDFNDKAESGGVDADSCRLPAEVAGCSTSSSNPGESDTCRPGWLSTACAKDV